MLHMPLIVSKWYLVSSFRFFSQKAVINEPSCEVVVYYEAEVVAVYYEDTLQKSSARKINESNFSNFLCFVYIT